MATITKWTLETRPLPSTVCSDDDTKFSYPTHPDSIEEMQISFYAQFLKPGALHRSDYRKLDPFVTASFSFSRMEYPYKGSICLKKLFETYVRDFFRQHTEFRQETRYVKAALQTHLTGSSEDEIHLKRLAVKGARRLDQEATPPNPVGIQIVTRFVFGDGRKDFVHSGHTLHVGLALSEGEHLGFMCNPKDLQRSSVHCYYPIRFSQAPPRLEVSTPEEEFSDEFDMAALADALTEEDPATVEEKTPTPQRHTFKVVLADQLSRSLAKCCLTLTIRNEDRSGSVSLSLCVGTPSQGNLTAKLTGQKFSFKVEFPKDLGIRSIRGNISNGKLRPEDDKIFTIFKERNGSGPAAPFVPKVKFHQETPALTFE